MSQARSVDTPMVKHERNAEAKEMSPQEATRFRRAVARLSYMAQDRGDLSYAASHLASYMARPRDGDELGVKRVLRYLVGKPRCILLFPFQDRGHGITVFTDSDWANDPDSRRSTSGGVVTRGTHTICWWSRRQARVALSSCESELNATVKGVSEALHLSFACRLFEESPVISLKLDSSAAKGVLMRSGSGKLKHVSAKQLWVQEYVSDGSVKVDKINRERNPSDAFTHEWSAKDWGFFVQCGFSVKQLDDV